MPSVARAVGAGILSRRVSIVICIASLATRIGSRLLRPIPSFWMTNSRSVEIRCRTNSSFQR